MKAGLDIRHEPPTDTLEKRRKYIRSTLFFLGLILCAVAIGIFSYFSGSGSRNLLENTAVIFFVLFGGGFVYCSEKLMGYRRLLPKQQQEVLTMAGEYDEIELYCRKVAAQERDLVVNEYDAMVAHAERFKDQKREPPEYGPAPPSG
jgi:hypothetical protein